MFYLHFKNLVYVKHDPSKIDINSSYVYMRVAEGTDTDALAKTLTERFFSNSIFTFIRIVLKMTSVSNISNIPHLVI